MRRHRGIWTKRGAALLAMVGMALTGAFDEADAQIVRGSVLESGSRQPIMLATVALVDTAFVVVDQTFSEDDGGFILEAQAPGSYWVVVDRIGYQPRMDGILEMGEDGFISVEFYLPPRPIQIEGLTATARRELARRHLETQGFYDRQDMGFGHHIGPADLEKRPIFDIPGLLRGIPRVVVSRDMRGSTVMFRGGREGGTCQPRILVDGSEIMPGIPIDDVADVRDIVGVEAYVGTASAPLEYVVNNTCGVLLIWTR